MERSQLKRQRMGTSSVKQTQFMLTEYNKLQKQSANKILKDVESLEQVFQSLNVSDDEAEIRNFLMNTCTFQSPIACGATGIVFKAIWEETQTVAVKLLSISSRSQYREAVKEAQIHSIFNHKNVVRLVSHKISDRFAVFVMEYVPKTLLSILVENDMKLTEDEASRIIRDVCEGLNHIHSKAVVHLDIKLDNILITDSGTAKICDFGSARHISDMEDMQKIRTRLSQSRSKSTKDSSSTFIGTPLYCSPESVENKTVNCKSDMWSLGVLTFVLLGGYLPFDMNKTPIAEQILQNRYTFYQEQWETISLFGRDFVSNLLKINAEKRFSAREALNHVWLNVPELPEQNDSEAKPKISLSSETKITKVLNTKMYLDLKTMSLNFFASCQSKQLALMAFSLLEKYIENMTKTFTTFLEFLIPTQQNSIEQMKQNNIVTSAKRDKKKKFILQQEFIGMNWTEDSEAKFCKLCDTKFSVITRRHHCRKCGQVICGECSRHSVKSHRVCDLCLNME